MVLRQLHATETNNHRMLYYVLFYNESIDLSATLNLLSTDPASEKINTQAVSPRIRKGSFSIFVASSSLPRKARFSNEKITRERRPKWFASPGNSVIPGTQWQRTMRKRRGVTASRRPKIRVTRVTSAWEVFQMLH